jgi:hypothetical protein
MISATASMAGVEPKPRATSVPSAFSPPRCKCGCGASQSTLTDKCDGCRSHALQSEPVIGAVTRRVERNPAFTRDLHHSRGQREAGTTQTSTPQRFRHDFSRLSIRNERGTAVPQGAAIAAPEAGRVIAGLSMAGEEVGGNGEDRVTAQTPSGPIAGPPPGPAAPACTYSIGYANQRTSPCEAGTCGAQIVFDAVNVKATGTGCLSLNGLMLTEVVTNDHGCSPANVQGGAGCPIDSHPPMLPTYGTVEGCTDTYAVCLGSVSQSKIPPGGCTETITQKLYVGGVLAETHFIRFPITKTASGCKGTVNRT